MFFDTYKLELNCLHTHARSRAYTFDLQNLHGIISNRSMKNDKEFIVLPLENQIDFDSPNFYLIDPCSIERVQLND